MLQFKGLQRVGPDLSTEQQQNGRCERKLVRFKRSPVGEMNRT